MPVSSPVACTCATLPKLGTTWNVNVSSGPQTFATFVFASDTAFGPAPLFGGELAGTTQVLFFTHHVRLCELAREAVPAEVLREHRLR